MGFRTAVFSASTAVALVVSGAALGQNLSDAEYELQTLSAISAINQITPPEAESNEELRSLTDDIASQLRSFGDTGPTLEQQQELRSSLDQLVAASSAEGGQPSAYVQSLIAEATREVEPVEPEPAALVTVEPVRVEPVPLSAPAPAAAPAAAPRPTARVEPVPAIVEPTPAPAAAAPPPVERHRVRLGETLGGIARQYYGDFNLYPRIYEANRDRLSNPNRIRAGMTLVIPR